MQRRTAATMRAAIHSLEARTNDGAAPNQEEISPNIKRAGDSTIQAQVSLPLSAVISHPIPTSALRSVSLNPTRVKVSTDRQGGRQTLSDRMRMNRLWLSSPFSKFQCRPFFIVGNLYFIPGILTPQGALQLHPLNFTSTKL